MRKVKPKKKKKVSCKVQAGRMPHFVEPIWESEALACLQGMDVLVISSNMKDVNFSELESKAVTGLRARAQLAPTR